MVAWGVSTADEFHRYVALVGTAIAFAADVILRSAIAVMHDTRLIAPQTDLSPVPTAMALWVISVVLASAYYRQRT
jgi:hypothetical protein